MMPRNEFQRDKNAELVARALHHLDIPARVNERHDIVVDNYKIGMAMDSLQRTNPLTSRDQLTN